MREPIHVSLLPAHPAEGSVSMLRYWISIRDAAANDDAVLTDCPYDMPPFPGIKGSKIKKGFFRYVFAPFLAATRLPSPVVHLLDHSSAHLIPFIQRSKKTVVTLHDLIPLRDPGGLNKAQLNRYRRCVKNLAKADHIICVSEYTRREAHELLGVPMEKMTVIPEGASMSDQASVAMLPKAGNDTVRILSVGSDLPRKNLQLLPAVVTELIKSGLRVELWRVGAPLSEAIIKKLDCMDCSRFVLKEWGRVDDSVLATCYRSSDCVLIPSLLEGFGLPVLEAMALGCPVVCSNASALPEAGGDAALYFDPHDLSSATSQILRLKKTPALARELARLGAEQANRLSWKNHWEGVKKIYASLDSGLTPDAAVGSSSRFCRVLGSELFVTDYSELSSPLLGSIGKSGKPLAVDFANTQIVTKRRHDHGFAKLSECMDLSLPDGMPLVWAMNRKGAELKDRIYGPTFTREFLKSCPGNLTHYLVGGSEECGKKFQERMLALNPSLQFIGSTHAKCTSEGVLEDDQAVLRDIQEKRPDFIWVGLGTPKQYGWINRIKPHLDHGVLLAVGFAFDVNAGLKSDAPLWMQRIGMTWAYRMACEPRRLIGRYLKWNTLFLYYIIFEEVEPLWNQLKLMVRNSFMKVVDLLASEIRDYVTGESLGRGLLFGCGGRANLIGHSGLPPLIPRFLPRKRLTYWKQPIGFTSHPHPDYQRLGNPPVSDKESERVMNVVLTHFHDNDALREMLGNWKEVCRVEDLWIAFGGTFNDFESLDYPRKVFIEESSLRVEDNQREKQSYTGIFRAMAAVVEREMPDYVYFSEYDHVPLVSDLNCRQVEEITRENADVMGHWLYRVDGTSNHHMLYHETDPTFLPFWKSVSRREDAGVVFSMLGTGSFWTREAFLSVAQHPQQISCYLELYLPTLVHHLGFRVRGWNDRKHLLSNLPSRSISMESGRELGCWTVHPIKNVKK